jgi:hypothetical protein
MRRPAKIYLLPNCPRPANELDRAEIRARVASAFACGDAYRRDETARQLEALAGEFRGGEHGELLLSMAARLLELRAKRLAAIDPVLASPLPLQTNDTCDQSS